jgi:hypothetical protein
MPSYHEKLTASAAKHPSRAALLMGVLVVLIIVLVGKSAVWRARYDECKRKSQFWGLQKKARARSPGNFIDTKPKSKCGCEGFSSVPKPGAEFDWTTPVCNALWDPAAVAESQALAQIGSLAVDNYGKKNLQMAADGKGPSNSELISLMKYGTAP